MHNITYAAWLKINKSVNQLINNHSSVGVLLMRELRIVWLDWIQITESLC